MRRRVDPHWRAVRILSRDVVIHLEEVPVALFNGGAPQSLDRVGKIEIDAAAACTDASSFVTDFLCRAGSDVAWSEISEARIFPLEVVIAFRFRDFQRRAFVAFLFRHPDASVIAQRLRHESQLRLVIARLWNARRMNLR